MDRVKFKKKLCKWIMEIGNNIWEARKNGWFPYFLIIFLFTNITYGQSTEKSQKQQKVIEKRTQRSTPTYTNTPPNDRYTPIQNQRVYRPYYYNPNIYGYTPYWNPHRSWDGRQYIITTDNSKTSPQPPMRISIGVLSEVTTQQSTISPYLVIGQKSFAIFQYHFGGRNSYPYYDNIYQWEVDEWEDTPMGNPIQRTEFVIGIGTTIDRISPFVGMGFGTQTQWDSYFDETYTLSSPRDLGIYTINEDTDKLRTLKLGFIYHWEQIEVISQISTFEGLSFGDGLRLGIGVGIKL